MLPSEIAESPTTTWRLSRPHIYLATRRSPVQIPSAPLTRRWTPVSLVGLSHFGSGSCVSQLDLASAPERWWLRILVSAPISAAKCVVDGGADSLEILLVDCSDVSGEH
jgi:hypothetical protein